MGPAQRKGHLRQEYVRKVIQVFKENQKVGGSNSERVWYSDGQGLLGLILAIQKPNLRPFFIYAIPVIWVARSLR